MEASREARLLLLQGDRVVRFERSFYIFLAGAGDIALRWTIATERTMNMSARDYFLFESPPSSRLFSILEKYGPLIRRILFLYHDAVFLPWIIITMLERVPINFRAAGEKPSV